MKKTIEYTLYFLFINIAMFLYASAPLTDEVFRTDLHGYVHEEVMWWHWLLWNFLNLFYPIILLLEIISIIIYFLPAKNVLEYGIE